MGNALIAEEYLPIMKSNASTVQCTLFFGRRNDGERSFTFVNYQIFQCLEIRFINISINGFSSYNFVLNHKTSLVCKYNSIQKYNEVRTN